MVTAHQTIMIRMTMVMEFLLHFELDASGNPLDTDGNGIIDPLDNDDDGDGLLTTDEDLNW
jgi:hypothetical protein